VYTDIFDEDVLINYTYIHVRKENKKKIRGRLNTQPPLHRMPLYVPIILSIISFLYFMQFHGSSIWG